MADAACGSQDELNLRKTAPLVPRAIVRSSRKTGPSIAAHRGHERNLARYREDVAIQIPANTAASPSTRLGVIGPSEIDSG
jgi:hypothetical protein